ncbi:hypothetical protein IEQ34_014932 [Dendrobium chrysotoxum]|uniref:Uncharacterized protein n=1 Tax=Dendrobium chrysotoxum TaxID=161865 RepID=A0AAV7GN35_DENCH|nr:hypothetical protein IEQ34_014932 [Dendrobium chrysotoxum]
MEAEAVMTKATMPTIMMRLGAPECSSLATEITGECGDRCGGGGGEGEGGEGNASISLILVWVSVSALLSSLSPLSS